jgi:hypothetical protein
MSYIKLVRPINLLFIGFIFYVMRIALIQPVLFASEYEPLLSNWQYGILALSIIFIAAAAFICFESSQDLLETDTPAGIFLFIFLCFGFFFFFFFFSKV